MALSDDITQFGSAGSGGMLTALSRGKGSQAAQKPPRNVLLELIEKEDEPEQEAPASPPPPKQPGDLLRQIVDMPLQKRKLSDVIASAAPVFVKQQPKGVPQGKFSTEAPKGFQPDTRTIGDIGLVPQSQSKEAAGFGRSQKLSELLSDVADKSSLPVQGLLFRIAGINPETEFAARTAVEGVNSALFTVPSKIAPEAYAALKEGMSTGNPTADFLADVTGQTAGTVKGAFPAIKAIAPEAGAAEMFALQPLPGHAIDVAEGRETLPQALGSEAVAYGSGKALEGAQQLAEALQPADVPSKAIAASTAALTNAPIGIASSAAESAIHKQPINPDDMIESAAMYGAFAALGTAMEGKPAEVPETSPIREAKKIEVDQAAHEAATSPENDLPEPTPLQQQSGNYKKGHVDVAGLDISVENPAGSVRKGIAADGKPWEVEMKDHYGYIKESTGADGDHVDAFIGPNPSSEKIFVVDQLNSEDENKPFDEHKVVLGADSQDDAREIYKRNFSDDASPRIGAITETTPDDLKAWIKDGNPREPFADSDVAKNGKITAVAPEESQGPQIEKPTQEVPPATIGENEHATKEGEQPASDLAEHSDRAGGGETARPGSGDSALGGENVEAGAGTAPRSQETARNPQAAESGKVVYGKETSVITTGGKIPARYAVREARDIETSHNPLNNFQKNPDWNIAQGEVRNTRDYTQKAEQAKVYDIAQNLRPEEIVNTSPGSTEGTPVTDVNGVTAGGNGRSMGVKLAYERGGEQANAYKQHIIDEAASFGIDPEKVAAMDEPVIHREMTGVDMSSMEKTDATKLVDDLNKSPSQSLDPINEAFKNSNRFDGSQVDKIISVIGEHESINDAIRKPAVSRNLVSAMEQAGVIDARTRPSLVTEGRLNDKGADLLQDMLLAKVMPDAETLRSLPKGLKNRITKAIPSLLAVEHSAIPEYSLRSDLKAAIEYKLRMDDFVRDGKGTMRDFQNQQDAFTEPLSVKQANLVNLLSLEGKGADARFKGALAEYARMAKQQITGANQDAMFGDEAGTAPTAEEIMARAAKLAERSEISTSGTLASEVFPGAQALGKAFEATYEQEIKPKLIATAEGVRNAALDIQRTFSPASRGELAKETALIGRDRIADLQRKDDISEHNFHEAEKALEKFPTAEKYKIIDRMERGEPQPTPELQKISDGLRTMFDDLVDQVHAIDPKKLQDVYENYFPHIWEDPAKAEKVFAQIFSKRPFEGTKSFLKQRTHEYFSEGLEAGLKPVSDNPITLSLLKAHEVRKFIMAHQWLNEMKSRGTLEYIPVSEKARLGLKMIDDKVSTVYGNPNIPIEESFDEAQMTKLNEVAKAIGVEHERLVKLGGQRLGYAREGTGEIKTKFASPESVLAHELGHQIDYKYGLKKEFVNNPETKLELRKLADARFAGHEPPESFRKYVRKGSEKMAVMLESYIHAPELFQEIAPKTYAKYDAFIKSHDELRPLSEIKPSLNFGSGTATVSAGGQVIRGHWYAPEEAANVVNNYLSPGIAQGRWGKGAGGAYRSLMGVSNLLNQAQLGMSAFHLGFVTIDSVTSNLALGIYEGAHGDVIKGAKTVAKSATAWFTNPILGNKILKEWVQPGSQGEEIGLYADAMQAAGGRAKMDAAYHTQITKNMLKAFRSGNVIGGAMRLPFAAIEQASRPIMEYVVPRMKAGAFANIARYEFERNHAELEGMSNADRNMRVRELMANAWNSVDNRLGQLVYDNLFWNKAAKDLTMASVRSVGWNLGTFRELGGGLVDYGKFVKDVATGNYKDADFTHRMSYVTAAPIVAGAIGGMIGWLMTGQLPHDLKDWFFPKTGGRDEQGNEARVALPSYMKDVFAYGTDVNDAFTLGKPGKMLRTIGNKANPIIGTVSEMLSNQDYYGAKIVGDKDNFLEKIGGHVGEAFTPFGVRGIIRNINNEGFSLKSTLPFVGVTPAPKELNETNASKLLQEYQKEDQSKGGFERTERKDYINRSAHAFRSGNSSEGRRIMREGIQKGVLTSFTSESKNPQYKGKHTSDDVAQIQKESKMTYLQSKFHHLPIDKAMEIYKVATPAERRGLKQMLLDKWDSKESGNTTEKELGELRGKFSEVRNLPVGR